GSCLAVPDEKTSQVETVGDEPATSLDEEALALLGLQARDRDDRPRAVGPDGRRREEARIRPAVDDDDPVARDGTVQPLEQATIELRDGHDKRGAGNLLPQHRPIDIDVMRVPGEAVWDPGEAARDVGGQRRMRRPMGMDVLDPRSAHST